MLEEERKKGEDNYIFTAGRGRKEQRLNFLLGSYEGRKKGKKKGGRVFLSPQPLTGGGGERERHPR